MTTTPPTMGLARLSPAQIKQLQRVFYAVDRDEDNVVSESDVVKTLRSLGMCVRRCADAGERDAAGEAPQYLGADATGADARGGIDATSFLTMFGTRMGAVADARKLLDAFECFDERDEGVIEVGVVHAVLADDPEAVGGTSDAARPHAGASLFGPEREAV